MNKTIYQMLEEEYVRTLEGLTKLEADSDAAKCALLKLAELNKQMTENMVAEAKEEQIKQEKMFKVIEVALSGMSIVLPIWASWVWMGRGLQFEKLGTFTSRTGQWLGNHFRIFKK